MSGKLLKKIVWLTLGVLLIGGSVYTLRPQPVLVEVGAPANRTVQQFISEEAITRLSAEYTIDMPINGTLERLALEVGDEVQAGQVIAQIVPFELEQELQSLESQIAQLRAQIEGVDVLEPKPEDIATAEVNARAASDTLRIAQKDREIASINLENARKEFERAQQLLKEGVAARAQVDEAQRAFRALEEGMASAQLREESAEKNLRVAELNAQRVKGSVDDQQPQREAYRAQIESLEAKKGLILDNLKKTEIKAPVTGPVLEKHIEDRRVLMAGTPLLKVGDLSTIEIEADILSEEVVRIEAGDPVEIIGKALRGKVVPGKVARIYPSAFRKISSLGIEQQRVKIIISFDNSEAQLRVGTRLDIRVITDSKESVLAVPERATFRRDGEWYVFVVQGGIAHLQPVKIGLRNDEWAEITGGLSAESQIVLEPKNEMEDGARVAAKAA